MKLKITCRCQRCSHKYSFTADSHDPEGADITDKPCPRCSKVQKTRGMDVSAGKAPGIGGSLAVKAMDLAADITMQNHGLTDLKSDGREGATMAPSLPHGQQVRADAMFASQKARVDMIGPRAKQMIAAAQRNKGLGAFAPPAQPAPNPIEMIHKARVRPNVTLLNPRARDGSIIS